MQYWSTCRVAYTDRVCPHDADQEGSLGRSWAERKVAHPQKLSRPSLSGLFSNMDSPDAPRGSMRSNPVSETDELGMAPPSLQLTAQF